MATAKSAWLAWLFVVCYSAVGLVVKSPAAGLAMPKCKDAPLKRTITPDDALRAQFVLALRERLIFRLAVCEGMRPGEIVALQIGDLRKGSFTLTGASTTARSTRPRAGAPDV